MAGSVEYHYKNLKQTLLHRRLLDYQLFYMISGNGRIQLHDKSIDISPGDLCLVQPGMIHSYYFAKSKLIYLHFDLFFHPYRQSTPIIPSGKIEFTESEEGSLQPALNDISGIEIPITVPVRDHDAVLTCLNGALALFKRTPPMYQLLLQEIIASLIKRFLDAGNVEDKAGELTIQERIDRAVLHMKANLHERNSLLTIARIAGLSMSHFSHEFKKRFGTGPVSFMNRMRMNAAAERIKGRPDKIITIAREFGYENPLNFSRDFKRILGFSPRSVRN
jgi:AraC-like DNA-binding protein